MRRKLAVLLFYKWFRHWDHRLAELLPPRIVFIVLLRVYQDALRNHGFTSKAESLPEAIDDWGRRAYPLDR